MDEDGLCGFGAEVGEVGVVFDGADVGFEHEVEAAGFGEGAGVGLADGFGGFLRAWGGGELVGAEAAFAGFAIDEWVVEGVFVAGGAPDGAVHEDGAVHADDVVAELCHGAPPVVFDVFFELSAEGAVVPGAVEAAVDF